MTFDLPPRKGGIQRYAAALVRELRGLGWRTRVIAPPGGRTRLGRVLTVAAALPGARRGLADRHTIATSWLPGFGAALLPRRWRGTLTVLAHGTELDASPGSLRERLMRFTFRRAQHVVACSAFTAGLVRARGLAREVTVAPPGVDPLAVRPARAARPTVLFVGRLVVRKGVDTLLDALALLAARGVEAELEIVGDGPDRARLEARAAARGVAGRVRFHGALDDAARDAAYARAWCFAMPARAEGGDVEGFGIVYLEAATAGLPAIGSRGGGAQEAIVDGETGLLVEPGDAAGLADALALLLGDPARAAAMGAAGRARALAGYTWRATAERIARRLALG